MAQYRDIKVGPAPSIDGVQFYTDSWAVVIGLGEYRDSTIPRLEGAVPDADAVEHALLDLGFAADHIFKRVNAEATKGEIERLFNRELFRATQSHDRVLFFFAGHGETHPTGRGTEGFLLPWDAEREYVIDTSLSMKAFGHMAGRLKAKHVLLVADACYSGDFLTTTRTAASAVDERMLAVFLEERAVEVITAGTDKQRAGEQGGQGILTRNFVSALRGMADEAGLGWMTAHQLAMWLQPRVMRDSDNRQHPQHGQLEGNGQFVFVLPPRAKIFQTATPDSSPAIQVGQGSELPGAFTKAFQRNEADKQPIGRALGPVERIAGKGEIQHFEERGGFDCCIARAAGRPDAYCVRGVIYNKYISMGGVDSFHGFPRTDELPAAVSRFRTYGRITQFSGQGASIHYHETGRFGAQREAKIGDAFEVHGAIGERYNSLRGTESVLGFPISDVRPEPMGYRSDFEGGSLFFDTQTGKVSMLVRAFDDAYSDSPFLHQWHQYDGLPQNDGCITLKQDAQSEVPRYFALRATGPSTALSYPGPPTGPALNSGERYCGITFRAVGQFVLYVRLSTAQGKERTVPIGRESVDGGWHTLILDLSKELAAGFPQEQFAAVQGFCFRGDVDVASVFLSDDPNLLRRSVVKPADPVGDAAKRPVEGKVVRTAPATKPMTAPGFPWSWAIGALSILALIALLVIASQDGHRESNREMPLPAAASGPEKTPVDTGQPSPKTPQEEKWDANDLLAPNRGWRLVASPLIPTRFWDSFQGYLDSTAVSADGKLLATGGLDGTIEIWDLGSGRELRTLDPDNSKPVDALAFSPARNMILAGERKGVGVKALDLSSGKLVWQSKPSKGIPWIDRVAVSPNGEWVAVGEFDVRILGLRTGRQLRTIDGNHGVINIVAISSDGRLIASGGGVGSGLVVSDAGDGRRLRSIDIGNPQAVGRSYFTEGLAFTDHDTKIIVADVERVRTFELSTGKLLDSVEGGRMLAAFPDDQGFATTTEKDIRVYAGGKFWILTAPADKIRALAVAQDHQVIAVDDVGVIRVWKPEW